jgi:hypothetical protein
MAKLRSRLTASVVSVSLPAIIALTPMIASGWTFATPRWRYTEQPCAGVGTAEPPLVALSEWWLILLRLRRRRGATEEEVTWCT